VAGRPRLHHLTTLAAAALAAAVLATPAEAQEAAPQSTPTTTATTGSSTGSRRDRGHIEVGNGEVVVGVRSERTVPGEPSTVTPAGPAALTRRCITGPVSNVLGGATSIYNAERLAVPSLVEGQPYSRLCMTSPNTWVYDGSFTYRGRNQPQPPEVVAQEALAQIQVPAPVPSTSPGIDLPQVVGLPTWLWIDAATWQPLQTTVEAGGYSLTAVVTPTKVTWDMGEDDDIRPVECDGPGKPYDLSLPAHVLQHSDCTYTYRWASDTLTGPDHADGRYQAAVTTTWTVAWSTSDGQTGTLTDLTRTTPFSLRVTEIQATICYSRPADCA
jgi:hypothetical protein